MKDIKKSDLIAIGSFKRTTIKNFVEIDLEHNGVNLFSVSVWDNEKQITLCDTLCFNSFIEAKKHALKMIKTVKNTICKVTK
jgi:hypothetical protein